MTTVQIDAEMLIVSGTGPRPASAEMAGARVVVPAALTGRGRTWRARFALKAARWGREALPLPPGEYRLRIAEADLSELRIETAQFDGMTVEVDGDVVTIRAPFEALGREFSRTLEARYAAADGGTENAVFFESFYGRVAGCNPRALDRELAARIPDLRRYWSVTDLSVEVPEGAIAVIDGSPEWWRARAASKLLIVNDWLRRRYVRKRGQKVLQTWHGTPLKRLALHRHGFHPRRMLAMVRESRRWDYLLAPNGYTASILRRAYAFFGKPIWTDGYPRNDALITGDAAVLREQLGIAPDERVLLYAPTWRDDRAEMVDFLDLERLANETDSVVLVRGHTNTLSAGGSHAGPRVIDVTGHPDIAGVQLLSDALITDYSSIAFDYSATGRPIYFFVPDIEHYRDDLRGFYFDLPRRAPGPLVADQDALLEALRDPHTADRYAKRYADWRRMFNRLDDGHAAERVVDRILDLGLLDDPRAE